MTIAISFLLSAVLCTAPVVRSGQIHFASGKTESYLTSPRTLRSADEAQERGLPVSIRHDVRVVPEWCRVLKTVTEVGYEDEVRTIEFFDFTGKRRGKSPKFYGKAHVLDATKRILLDGASSHFLNYDTFLLNRNGVVITKIVRPTTSLLGTGFSKDQRLIWVASNIVRNGRPHADVQVISCDGTAVTRRTLSAAGRITVRYRQRNYVFEIPAAKLPE